MRQDAYQQLIDAVMPTVIDSGLLKSLCTIQRPSGSQAADGTQDGLYVPIVGLIGIRCTTPPSASAKGMPAAEVRGPADTFATKPLHVLLDGFYAKVEDAWLGTPTQLGGGIATISSPPNFPPKDYTLIAAENDSQIKMVRMEVRLGKL